jgi:uncharacterized protein YodC (DUF2158 family)
LLGRRPTFCRWSDRAERLQSGHPNLKALQEEPIMAKTWNSGDKVKLPSGGPVMTVVMQYKQQFTHIEKVKCQWFDGKGNLKESEFVDDSLEAVK